MCIQFCGQNVFSHSFFENFASGEIAQLKQNLQAISDMQDANNKRIDHAFSAVADDQEELAQIITDQASLSELRLVLTSCK